MRDVRMWLTRWFNTYSSPLYTVLRTPFYTEEAERIYVMTERFRGCGNGASIMPTPRMTRMFDDRLNIDAILMDQRPGENVGGS
jgi:hypothetical protein